MQSITRTLTRAKIVFIALIALYWLQALVVAGADTPIATHFGLDGRANDWMSSGGFLMFHCWMTALILAVRWFIAASARWQQGINIPEYRTFSDTQKHLFAGFMDVHSWSFGCLLAGMFLAIDGLILLANTRVPASLPLVFGLLLTMVFLGGMGWWTLRIFTEVKNIAQKVQ
ncbi:MAG: hypothetical protein MUF71_00160 [Candidatus Kapabacteria bacterium]|jgi:uncharacterized membrane protein|nr:hypothetical protein [Candidatus Kapabacteria bacterium]